MAVKYFELNGVKLKLEFYKLYYWYDKNTNSRKLKKPYWREKKLTKNKFGYLYATIDKKQYFFHRIVYYAYNQDWDIRFNRDNTIDHIDRNKSNNNIFNLRLATRLQQALNRSHVDDAKGYSYSKANRNYRAQIGLNKKHKKYLEELNIKD